MSFENGNQCCKAVIFDLDGTLINSIDFYRKILHEVFERLNLPLFSDASFLAAMQNGGFTWESVIPADFISNVENVIQSADQMARSIFAQKYQKEIQLIPGTKEVLIKLRQKGIKIGLVTSTCRKTLTAKFTPFVQNGLESFFEAVVTSDDVASVKPAADPLLKAIKTLGISINSSVYVGDTCVDIQAGKAAGMKTIAVLTGVGSYEDLKCEAPDAIIESVAQIFSRDRIVV
jgi:HAD superfamily hydrolase (TIGR01662 family)